MGTAYFKPFRKIRYDFGDEKSGNLMQDLTQYVDLIDQVKGNVSFYEDYTIPTGERPDTLSFKLYGTTDYYWTFFLLNDSMRESGWPINNEDIEALAKKSYPHRVITTNDDLATTPYNFPVGTQIIGNESGTIGNIIKRNLSLGQIIVDTENSYYVESRTVVISPNTNGYVEFALVESNEKFSKDDADDLIVVRKNLTTSLTERFSDALETFNKDDNIVAISELLFDDNYEYQIEYLVKIFNTTDLAFQDGEQFSYRDPSTGHNVARTILTDKPQHLATHHWEDALGNWVDIDPFDQVINPAGLNNITYVERIIKFNSELKQIKVLKKDVVRSVAKEFSSLMGS